MQSLNTHSRCVRKVVSHLPCGVRDEVMTPAKNSGNLVEIGSTVSKDAVKVHQKRMTDSGEVSVRRESHRTACPGRAWRGVDEESFELLPCAASCCLIVNVAPHTRSSVGALRASSTSLNGLPFSVALGSVRRLDEPNFETLFPRKWPFFLSLGFLSGSKNHESLNIKIFN